MRSWKQRAAAAVAAAAMLTGCAGLTHGIRVAHEATSSVRLTGQEVFERVCGELAYNCVAEGTSESNCTPFHQCRALFQKFNNLTVAAQSALALAESARARGVDDDADRLFDDAMKFLKAASDLIEDLVGFKNIPATNGGN